MRKWTGWLYKRWMLFGIFLARWIAPLQKWKMAVGDSMVLACTLTMPTQPDMTPWPEKTVPLLVMFRPPKGASGPYELWEAQPDAETPAPAKDRFEKTGYAAMPLYEGRAYLFVTDNLGRPAHYFVRCYNGPQYTDSGIIVSKLHEGQTRFHMDMVSVEPGSPTVFRWPRAANANHWIHFLIVAQGDRLLTGIYLRGTEWPYPKLSDLPYYIHDPLHAPPLQKGQTYQLMYMAVDNDGWVSDLCSRMLPL
jgi:hypothetical protein